MQVQKHGILLFLMMIGFFSIGKSQYNLTLLGQFDYPDPNEMSGCWGYNDSLGNEYGIIGTMLGTSILDITDPTMPVELFFIEGKENIWREVKVWNKHAYISTEAEDEGMLIIDLQNLPTSIDTVTFKGDLLHPFTTAHTIFIDEKGFCYLFGHQTATGLGGAYIVDLNPDPKAPVFVAEYTEAYIHDGYVRNDTLWAAEIYEGRFTVLDVSDKSDIILMGLQNTGAMAAHNCWLSDDSKYLFTTDEINFGFLESFDVQDITDIKKLDEIKHGNPDSTIAHNVYFKDGYLITAHYTEGVTIHDAHKPDNLVEVAHYDTSPFGPESGFSGVWGAYPYFDSEHIIATDRIGTVFIFEPDYNRASYLEGTITDTVTNLGLFNAEIKIIDTEIKEFSSITGAYKTGYYAGGFYDVEISAEGCITKTFFSVEFIPSEITILNAALHCEQNAVDAPLFPNSVFAFYDPDHQNIIVKYNLPGMAELYLLNVLGQKLLTLQISEEGTYTIDAKHLTPGAYFLGGAEDINLKYKKIMVY